VGNGSALGISASAAIKNFGGLGTVRWESLAASNRDLKRGLAWCCRRAARAGKEGEH
jgi:hypothetical protein